MEGEARPHNSEKTCWNCLCVDFKGERMGEIRKNFSDITKAKERLGFHPEVDLEQGLEELPDQPPCPSIPNI